MSFLHPKHAKLHLKRGNDWGLKKESKIKPRTSAGPNFRRRSRIGRSRCPGLPNPSANPLQPSPQPPFPTPPPFSPKAKIQEVVNPRFLDAAFLLTVGSFLLTVELFYLQLTILAFLLTVGAFLLTILASLLTVGAFCLQWESASNQGLKGLQPKKLNCKQKSSNCKQKASPAFLSPRLGSTERGAWRRVGRKGWRKVGETLAKGWRKVGKGLVKGWQRVGGFLAPCNFAIPEVTV